MLTREIRRLLKRDHRYALLVRARANSSEVRLAERVVDDSGVATQLAQLLEDARINGAGRPGELPVRALLVGLVTLALLGQPLHLRRCAELLANLPRPVRDRLGIIRPDGSRVTERQVTYLFSRVRRELDPSPHTADDLDEEARDIRAERLQALCDALLAATLPDERDSGSYALDATAIEAWARGYRSPARWRDPDAGWSVKTPGGSTDLEREGGDTKPRAAKGIFGYDVHLLTWIRDDSQTEAPPALTERVLVFGGGRSDAETIADAVADAIVRPAAEQPPGDVVCDRWYTQQRAGRFAMPIRRAGGQLVMELKDDQRGPQGTFRGALKVDGELYCPAMPAGLHNLPPAHYRNTGQMQARAQVAARREPYRMLPLNLPDANGTQRVQCPAQRGRVRCPLKEASLERDPATHQTVVAPPQAPPACCTQKSFTVPAATLGRIKQKHPYGTAVHKASFDRRNVVEGAIGTLRNAGAQDIKKDHIRVMGLAATTLLITIAVAAMNVRLLAHHIERTDAADDGPEDTPAGPPPPGSYDDVIQRDRAAAQRRREREREAAQIAAALEAGDDPPQAP